MLLTSWAAGFLVALFAATLVVKFAKGDPTWYVEAILVGIAIPLLLFILTRIRRFRMARALSIEHAGAQDARVTVTPMTPRGETLSFRRGDLGRVWLGADGRSRRKQLVFAGLRGPSGTEPATLSLTASCEADDPSIERLHHSINAALESESLPHPAGDSWRGSRNRS